MVRKSRARKWRRVHESQIERMGNRERIGENLFPEVLESLKKSDALVLQGVSKNYDQRFEVDSRIDFPGFQLLVNIDEQSGRLFRGSFQVGSHRSIVPNVWNWVQNEVLRRRTLASEAKAPEERSGNEAVILLWMTGGPSPIDTLDPKPDRPLQNRGWFGVIQTKLPGVGLCEHMPKIASMLDRCTM
jgi:Protein of unknown function (DUF1501)